jgi:hypothetical protein
LLVLKKCPWCSAALEKTQIKFEPNRLIVQCSNAGCDFRDGLPIATIDEHIWNYPPSFVVATIDKFAQLTWEPAFGSILGVGTGSLPPDLVIQDELHLITDALGTVAGIYETVLDCLMRRDGRGPKIVGATATIRRAGEQISRLFNRRTMQFPPSGVDHDDSFFYSQDNSVPGRMYVGVHAQGRSPKHTLPRIIGGLLQATSSLSPDSVRDLFWTLVCYFNSLRELGGALVITEDDVPAYQEVLSKYNDQPVRKARTIVELTSAVPSYRIPEILEQLGIRLTDPPEKADPIDILLATNMISVGVDISRLGVMIIAGQPKTTAEYIQASSRVGRSRGSSGLVIIQYNWTRPRDRSHYERFRPYHGAFYRFVEASSVTPFAPRARDRALRGAVVALARSMCADMQSNKIDDPVRLAARLPELLKPLVAAFVERVQAVDQRETPATREEIENLVGELSRFLTHLPERTKYWCWWGVSPDDQDNGLFVLTDDENRRTGLWTAMLSMRDTDAPSPLALEVQEA